MTEDPTPPSADARPARSARAAWLAPLALVLAVLAIITAGLVFWNVEMRIQDLQLQLARRIGEFDNSSKEARSAAKEVQASVDGLAARVTTLEAKAQVAQNQQLALQAMYDDLSRGKDQRMLADIGQTLLLANQELVMAGNVRAALLGLESAGARLAQLNKPQFGALQAAIGRDEAKLKLLPAANIAQINARLDTLLQEVDELKLVSEPEAQVEPAAKAPPAAVDWLERLGGETWDQIRQLVRIRRLDHPDAALLEPSQIYFLRQNLKLRLLSARLAALERDEPTYRADIDASRAWIGKYFNRKDPLTRTMQASLKDLAATPVALQNVNLNDSLDVLHSLTGMVH